jgi:hypothetical protein
MNKSAVFGFLAIAFLGACTSTRTSLSSVDDVYAIPAEEQAKEKALAEAQAKQRAQERAEEAARQAAQQTTADPDAIHIADNSTNYNDPKYKDSDYSADDYYDYAYSSRLNRFAHPMGLGYYDNFYTNSYTYNQNPAYYGTSIYSGYWSGMPSNSFNMMSIGIGNSWSYGNSYGYSPYGYSSYGGSYGYNSYGYNPMYSSYGYSPYGYSSYGYNPYSYYGYGYGSPYSYGGYNNYWSGYNQGYNQGYSSGWNNEHWGYFNSYDVNSAYSQMTNAPRESHGGGMRNPVNGAREGTSQNQSSYLEEVANQQQTRQRFYSNPNDRIARERATNSQNPARNSGSTAPSTAPSTTSYDGRGNAGRNDGRIIQQREQNAPPMRREHSTPVFNSGNSGFPSGGSDGGRRGGGDGGSSPRNSGGGEGGHRPR